MSDPLQVVLDYHERTKHHLDRYARSLGYLDWATQPDPFRCYEGAEKIVLDEVPVEPGDGYPRALSYDQMMDAPAPAPGRVVPRTFDHAFISQLFYDSLALSAWKNFRGSRWSLRVNPSSGNLHPTEGYLVYSGGVFHYNVFEHALEKRRAFSPQQWAKLAAGLPPETILVGLTSIYWREAWKYGERAFRYCMHDVGHAVAAVMIAARVMGWSSALLEAGDDELADLLGVGDQTGPEAEHADCLIALYPNTSVFAVEEQRGWRLPALELGPWIGTPNVLSAEHHDWPVIDEVAAATRRATVSREADWMPFVLPSPQPSPSEGRGGKSARQVIRQRRSAVAMDGKTFITAEQFRGMMRRARMHLLPWRPCVHLAVFVHRVHDMTPGMYLLVRDDSQLASLRTAFGRDFLWRDEGDGLYLLHQADCRGAAKTISCHQDIAADGCFAVGMLARFEPALREHGPWMYRRLFWETGAIGQVLYLEAEFADIRATGIGCFFDDSMHEVLGLRGRGRDYQSLYHFTVGGPVDDPRLEDEPPYAHLRRTAAGH